MTDSYVAGEDAVLLVEWALYSGGPPTDVTAQTITIKTAAGVTVVAATAVGISHVATGLYSYTWSISASQAAGSYVVIWDATDAELESVQASEVIAVEAAASALGDPYITAAQLKTRLGISDTVDDTAAAEAVLAASRAIDKYTGRQFNKATTASARLLYPGASAYVLAVPDFWTSTDLVIAADDGRDGSYGTTWASTDYQLEPLNGIADGETGWPYNRIRAVGSYRWPDVSASTIVPIRVTAKWGWADKPAGVLSASYLLAADVLALKDARFGQSGGMGEFGPWLVRQNRSAMMMLDPYRIDPVRVA
jgi:hypothetical protein